MDGIRLMVDEHENILRMNAVIRSACLRAIADGTVDTTDFRRMIDFIRGYADKHHHGKEEQILFAEMQDKLGEIGINLIQHGMLVEHDFGRLFVAELEAALAAFDKSPIPSNVLDIVANAVGYTNLLSRHIEKENAVIYSYAQKHLSEEVLAGVHLRTETFEAEAVQNGIPAKYLAILAALEQKYK